MSCICQKLIPILVGSVKHQGPQMIDTQYLLNLLKKAEKEVQKDIKRRELKDLEAEFDAQDFGGR